MTITHPWTTDNRHGPGNSGASAPENSPAAYSARWIDQGDHTPADVLPDRQGLAYNDIEDTAALIQMLETHNAGTLHHGVGHDVTTCSVDKPHFKLVLRRAGGYVYVDAWLQPAADQPPADPLEAPYGTQTACRDCGLDIEYHGSAQWLDRGGNWSCGDRDHHVPMVNWDTPPPRKHAFDFEVNDGPVSYHPWTNGYAIGFEVHRSDGRIEFIYLNPSQSDGDEAEANVFLYTGTEGDPAADEAHHHYLVDEDAS